MKTFYGDTFISKEELEAEEITYPIKLEYYKIVNDSIRNNQYNIKYGIDIVKTEYKKDNTNVEEEKLKYITNDERQVDDILEMLKQNEVTPIGVKDVISDYLNEVLFKYR